MQTVIGDGQCVWYDQCSSNPDKPSDKLNCRYDGPPKKLPTTSVSVFTTTCPELVDEIIDDYGEIVTCCSPNQILTLLNHLTTLTVVVENCPACVSNLRKNFCYFTCHPRHSAFVNPTLLYNDSVWTVSQYSSYIYIDEAYDSCDTVFFDQENTLALNFLCGPWGGEKCTPERLFDSLGNNFLAAFNVSYIYGDNNTTAPIVEDPTQMRLIYPFNVETHPCNSSDPVYKCDCNNCEEMCPVAAQPVLLPVEEHLLRKKVSKAQNGAA
ncbi:Niemann-Pick C1-like protein 1 [Armadillidium nasatum]|uniref:Niemann-Pick C1-like protein 1 n=1 Tax=Armadillidium nasatum TaxID=96803 RepID=A0A5N5TDY5_9CRUS|nr:Niemann-Pick C1-like protein 1 [Armadillidium nasatum]